MPSRPPSLPAKGAIHASHTLSMERSHARPSRSYSLGDGIREDPGRHVPRGARDQGGTAQGRLYGEADRVEDGAQGRPAEPGLH